MSSSILGGFKRSQGDEYLAKNPGRNEETTIENHMTANVEIQYPRHLPKGLPVVKLKEWMFLGHRKKTHPFGTLAGRSRYRRFIS